MLKLHELKFLTTIKLFDLSLINASGVVYEEHLEVEHVLANDANACEQW